MVLKYVDLDTGEIVATEKRWTVLKEEFDEDGVRRLNGTNANKPFYAVFCEEFEHISEQADN